MGTWSWWRSRQTPEVYFQSLFYQTISETLLKLKNTVIFHGLKKTTTVSGNVKNNCLYILEPNYITSLSFKKGNTPSQISLKLSFISWKCFHGLVVWNRLFLWTWLGCLTCCSTFTSVAAVGLIQHRNCQTLLECSLGRQGLYPTYEVLHIFSLHLQFLSLLLQVRLWALPRIDTTPEYPTGSDWIEGEDRQALSPCPCSCIRCTTHDTAACTLKRPVCPIKSAPAQEGFQLSLQMGDVKKPLQYHQNPAVLFETKLCSALAVLPWFAMGGKH